MPNFVALRNISENGVIEEPVRVRKKGDSHDYILRSHLIPRPLLELGRRRAFKTWTMIGHGQAAWKVLAVFLRVASNHCGSNVRDARQPEAVRDAGRWARHAACVAG